MSCPDLIATQQKFYSNLPINSEDVRVQTNYFYHYINQLHADFIMYVILILFYYYIQPLFFLSFSPLNQNGLKN